MDSQLLGMIKYATKKHGDQRRKYNRRPYVADHCMRLLQRVACDPRFGHDLTASLIILGHDVVEDCSKSDTDEDRQVLYTEIIEKFNYDVRAGIFELTDEYTKKRHPTWNRKKRKKAETNRLAGISERGRTLKLYDRHINLEDTLADKDFNPVYAQESWDLGYHLSDSNNMYIAAKVMSLAAEIKSHCKK